MKIANFARPLSGVVTFTATTAMTSVAAMAACAGAPTLVALSGLVGPPSISATESSTDQALELIRKRREEASGACPSGFTRSGGNCVPAGAAAEAAPQVAAAAPAPAVSVTTTTTTGPAVGPQPKRPQVSRPASQQAAAPAAISQGSAPSGSGYGAGYSGGSIKDGAYNMAMPGTLRATGVWVEGYYDYERHSNINPGQANTSATDVNGNVFGTRNNPTRRTVSGGIISGVDITNIETGGVTRGYQLGLLGGYNSTRAKFSDTQTVNTATGADGRDTQVDRFSGARQDIEGASIGAYASAVRGAVSGDVAVKVDFFDVERRFTQQSDLYYDCQFVGGLLPATPSQSSTTASITSTTMTNVTLASNLNYRFAMSPSFYVEPTAGLRWTYSDFGGGAFAMGMRDGDVFRVQGGVRLGTTFRTPDGWVWNTALTGLLYSDVSINGYTIATPVGGAFNSFSAKIDEGKLRVLGMVESRVDVGYGYSLYGDLSVRGGEDVFGFGARGGVRYQW